MFKDTLGVAWAGLDVLDAVIWQRMVRFLTDESPFELFQSIGIALALCIAPTILLEEPVDEDKRLGYKTRLAYKVADYVPIIAGNIAIWGFTGPTAAGIFAGAMLGGTILWGVETAHRYCVGDKFTWHGFAFDFLTRVVKPACIVATLVMGEEEGIEIGKIGELSLTGKPIPVPHQVTGLAAMSIAYFSAAYRLFPAVKAVANHCRKPQELTAPGYSKVGSQ